MPFAKRGDVVHSEATSGFNNQKKSLLINGLAALGDSHHPLQFYFSKTKTYRDLCFFRGVPGEFCPMKDSSFACSIFP